MAYQSLDEILSINLKLEEQFVSFLKHIRPRISGEEDRKIVQALLEHCREDLLKMEEMKNLPVEKKEYVKNVPHVRIEDDLPKMEGESEWNLNSLFERVLRYQEAQLRFYQRLWEVVSFDRSRDICDSVVKLKNEQIKWIGALQRDNETL